MTSWKVIDRSFRAILKKVGSPPIKLVSSGEFYEITGARLGSFCGRCSPKHRIVTVNRNRPLEDIKDTLWHEVAHILFPSKPHWWIECFASKMCGSKPCGSWQRTKNGVMSSGVACGRYSLRYCKSKDDLPNKTKLLDLALKSSTRLIKGE